MGANKCTESKLVVRVQSQGGATCANGMRGYWAKTVTNSVVEEYRLTSFNKLTYCGSRSLLSGICWTLISLKNNEERVGDEESAALVLGKMSLSEDNPVVREMVDSEKMEAESRTLIIKEVESEEAKSLPGTLTGAEAAELRKIVGPPT